MEKKDFLAADINIRVCKDMEIKMSGVSINETLYNVLYQIINDAINEKFTAEERQKMLDLLLKENKDTMFSRKTKRVQKPINERNKTKARNTAITKWAFKDGYRSPYLPQKKH
jgi:hypothetical protein